MLALGIDVGGTMIKAGLVNSKGEIIAEDKVDTNVDQGQEQVIARICGLGLDLLSDNGIELKALAGIGIGIPGFVNYTKGEVLFAPNLKWQKVNLKEIMQERLKLQQLNLPLLLDNDVNVAAQGELLFGAGKDTKHFVMLTVGTGLGGALITNGQVYRGSLGLAGEIGHLVIQENGLNCSCGKKGCLETLTSATAILKYAKEKGLEVKEAKDVFALAEKGNQLANLVIKQAAYYLGLGISNLINLLDPEKVIIGGGISKAGDIFFRPIRKTVADLSVNLSLHNVEILPAKLRNKAGIVGASALVFAKKNKP